jgi:hypothetical protein
MHMLHCLFIIQIRGAIMKHVRIKLLPCMLAILLMGVFLPTQLVHGASTPDSNCSKSWSVISSPNPGFEGDSFESIAAITGKDIWAVGYYSNGTNNQGMTQHWDGTSWSVVPDASPSNAVIMGVAAIATNDVWAVGGTGEQGFTEHWDGSTWTAVANPAQATTILDAVAAVSSTDVWAVGDTISSTSQNTLIEHWDGTQWSIVNSPSVPSASNYLNAVTAISATNVWAVGTAYSGALNSQTLIEHWNGHKWKIITSPDVPGDAYNGLTGVAGASSHNIWAVGNGENEFFQAQSFIEHWNGTSWSIVTGATTPTADLFSIAVVSGKNAWAVGSTSDPNYGNGITMIEHWNGSTWNIVNSPSPGSFDNELLAVARIPGTGHIWSAGYLNNGLAPQAKQTLTEYYC